MTKAAIVDFLDKVNDNIIAFNKEGSITYVNSAFAEIIGLKTSDAIGRNIWKIRPKLVGSTVYKKVIEAMEKNTVITFEWKGPYSEHIYETTVFPSEDGVTAIGRDITKRKKDEIALRETEERFRSLVESTSDWIWQVDENAKYTYASPKIRDMLGYEPEEIIGKTPFDLMPKDEASRVSKLFEVIASSKQPFHNLENWNTHKNGKLVLLETSGVPILDDKGSLRGYRGIDRDATERQEIMEALKLSEEKFSKAFRCSPSAVTVTRLSDGKVLEANDSVEELLGYNPKEAIGHTTLELGIWVDPQDRIALGKTLASRGYVDNKEFALRKKDGTQITVILSAAMVKIQGEDCFVSSFIDISRRKKAEEALKESEQLYRILFDNSEDGFLLFELIYNSKGIASDLRFLKLNAAYEKQTGIAASTVLGQKASEAIPELNKSMLPLSAKVALTHKSERIEIYDQHSNKWYDIYYFPYSKNQVGILLRDISKRKEAEEALFESETKYRNLVDKLPEMVFEINGRGQVVFANSVALQTLGYTKDELVNFDANRFVAPDYVELSRKNMKKMFAGGMRQSNEYVFIKKDGARLPVLLTSAPIIRDGKIVGARGIVVDLTERKKMESQLEEKERLATIGATARMVGHDIRNPLQAMIGEVYLLKSDLEKMPEGETKKNTAESIDNIEKNILYINKIVADLQDYTKPLTPDYKPFNLSEVLISVFDSIYTPDSIKITLNIKKCPQLQSDPEYIRRALTNLVNNAIQAMPDGGNLTISAFANGGKVQITVEDTGVGIPEEAKSKLFTPMVTTKAKGQGLGLAVVKRLVEALNGTISFESQYKKGTKFTIELPLIIQ